MNNLKRSLETNRKKMAIRRWLSFKGRFDRLDGYSAKEINKIHSALSKTINRMHLKKDTQLLNI